MQCTVNSRTANAELRHAEPGDLLGRLSPSPAAATCAYSIGLPDRGRMLLAHSCPHARARCTKWIGARDSSRSIMEHLCCLAVDWQLAALRDKRSPGWLSAAYAQRVRRSPQEEKALSYARDCRYAYGNNSKAARKAVPRRKRWVNKANRHAGQELLAEGRGLVDADRAEDIEDRLRGTRPKRWRKKPDIPLGRLLERRREPAGSDHMRPGTAKP